MSGIAGWVSYNSDIPSQKEIVAKMTKTMVRRGPDAVGCGSIATSGLATVVSPSLTSRAARSR
jgi:asparagine synthetase B (glutamine-hydrolysing)